MKTEPNLTRKSKRTTTPKPEAKQRLQKDRKPPKQAARIRITSTPIGECTPLRIPEINATVYVKPGQSIEEVRARYLANRFKL